MNADGEPQFVVVAGDWHGNLNWALHTIAESDRMLTEAGEDRKIIIQLGDFGFRPHADDLGLLLMNATLAERDMELWWIDGNHEHWPDIRRLMPEHQFDDDGYPTQTVPIPGLPRIRYLPRGTRWTWAGRTWLAVGGAASVDRLLREEGVSWWPDEELTVTEATRIATDGPADVLLSHDCPEAWVPWDLLPYPVPEAWKPELPRARAHAARLEDVARLTGVRRVLHGHYHVFSESVHGGFEKPTVRVTALEADGVYRNFQLVDVGRVCGADADGDDDE